MRRWHEATWKTKRNAKILKRKYFCDVCHADINDGGPVYADGMERQVKIWNIDKGAYDIRRERIAHDVLCKQCVIAKNFMAFVG